MSDPISHLNPKLGRGRLVWSGRNVGKIVSIHPSRRHARVLVLAGVRAGEERIWVQWREASEADLTRIRKWYEDQAFKLSIPMRGQLQDGSVLEVDSV